MICIYIYIYIYIGAGGRLRAGPADSLLQHRLLQVSPGRAQTVLFTYLATASGLRKPSWPNV